MGIAVSIARAVTQIVPIMNGKNPKFPAIGSHDEEKRSSVRGSWVRILPDFWKSTTIMAISTIPENNVGIKRTLLITRSRDSCIKAYPRLS